MIIDKLENLGNYASLNPLFAEVVEYMSVTDLRSQAAGKVHIKGSDLFVNFNVCKGKTREEARLETHDMMIDIQIPLSSAEVMGYTPRAELPEQPYNKDSDITFYEGLAQQYITVSPGMFAIFFPQDGHAPAICESDELHKVIFKVKAI